MQINAEALVFGIAWAALAVAAGIFAGWTAGAVLSVGMLLLIMPASSLILSRTGNFTTERQVRWAILAFGAIALIVYLEA